MKRKIQLFAVIAALGMAFVGCSQPELPPNPEPSAPVEQQPEENTEEPAEEEEEEFEPVAPEDMPSRVSKVTSAADVPLIDLNNGAQIPQFGFDAELKSLSKDPSEEGRAALNEATAKNVALALTLGYRHIDTAHSYANEKGVGQGIIDSGVPREEIWISSKLWPSEYGEGTTMEAIDAMLERLQTDYIDCLYLHHPAGDYVSAWKDMEKAYKQGKIRALGLCNFEGESDAFDLIMQNAEIKPQLVEMERHPFAQREEAMAIAAENEMQPESWYAIGHEDEELLENEILTSIADAHQKSVKQIILRWQIQSGAVVTMGAEDEALMKEYISVFDFELTPEEMEQIKTLDKGDAGRLAKLDYKQLGSVLTTPVTD